LYCTKKRGDGRSAYDYNPITQRFFFKYRRRKRLNFIFEANSEMGELDSGVFGGSKHLGRNGQEVPKEARDIENYEG
jgi:hypothetical protein